MDFEGLDLSEKVKKELFVIDKDLWNAEIAEIEKFYASLDFIPEDLENELEELKKRVSEI